MIPLTLAEIAQITGGELTDGADPQARVTGFVEFDSRKVTPGGLFLALPGARVDGHDFAATATEAGAVAVLAARPVGVPAVVVTPTGRSDSNADIYAHDTDGSARAVVEALAALAHGVVTRLPDLTVVGITGSAGKTSTKDLVASVLRQAGETVAPPGSFNNEIGHPYTALRCDADTRFLVAEMSARGIGHIAHLAESVPPHIGVVLNVGSAHLGEFGSRENIAQAKGELVEALPDAGVAILNADDPFVAAMAPRTRARVVTYSTQQRADLWADDIRLDDVARASFTLHAGDTTAPVTLQVFGEHQVSNALAAAAVGIEAGLSVAQVAAGLSAHTNASAHRMDVQTRADGVTVINDAYNANPDSMSAGIAALAYTAAARPHARAIAVLGEMGELGEDAEESHRLLGEQLDRYRVGHLIAVGDNPNSRAMATEARNRGITTEIAHDVDEATRLVDAVLRTRPIEHTGPGNPGDVVLVKASNALGLWRVAEQLIEKGL
ncbi:UDP-N-acetylmuramoyl-tripeptide--D-alanyl-D-alanine ligase [Corynebacterium pollutisoli]|uniref:UDP-N-acetylmuramoyl-tripeptide--D-alanyl-D-alanine ligase n=1 Tax=Corynebacterium pollutisoli TaxID=1610489 RepID=A0A1X7I5G7_9CORY|nr:UDP-N-acetylmuramoyl-tripeptide--D-alanyl-D-alanine ligase [Corynebacterium pollutisoli]SMG09096.1 UDP-N-acetylmuramoyl-tripeptide--D-alanyl-D-alanine ligase [Corynebacterium pollutisoli]HJD77895.1 UDP-N-acetylmuramoyl-tripeptide--D-alanyl-D-alanine ligase [Corynebacterium pollutisoli]